MIKMVKKIVVDSCEHCPLKEQALEPNRVYYLCMHPETEYRDIGYMHSIPSWCPLEDN